MVNVKASIRKFKTRGSMRKRKVLDNQVRVSTPENISFQYEIVGPSRRLMAYLLDVLLTLVAYGIAAIAVGLLVAWLAAVLRGTPMSPFLDLLISLAVTVFAVGGFLSLWFYGAYMETNYNGQTFGKMMCSIRAISTDGSAIDGTQATLRNFFRWADVMPLVPLALIFGSDAGQLPIPLFTVGLISMSLSPKYQRLGDFVANTIVVGEARKWTHGLAQFPDPRVPQLAGLIPDNFVVSPGLATALAEYVDRRQILPYQRANEIALHIGTPLISHFGLPANTNSDLLLCALYYKTFVHENQSKDNPFQVADSFESKPNTDDSDERANEVPFTAEEIIG